MKLYYSPGACSLSPHIERLRWVDGELAGRTYLLGEQFSVADAYLFVVAGWGRHAGVDTAPLAKLSAFPARVAARPAVQAAMRNEGLLQ